MDAGSLGLLAFATLRNEWLGGAIHAFCPMPNFDVFLWVWRNVMLDLLKQLLGTGYDLPGAKRSHYGVDLAATRVLHPADAISTIWKYRHLVLRPDARPLDRADFRARALLQRAVLKHPELNTPRQQATHAFAGTKPFVFYTRLAFRERAEEEEE